MNESPGLLAAGSDELQQLAHRQVVLLLHKVAHVLKICQGQRGRGSAPFVQQAPQVSIADWSHLVHVPAKDALEHRAIAKPLHQEKTKGNVATTVQ